MLHETIKSALLDQVSDADPFDFEPDISKVLDTVFETMDIEEETDRIVDDTTEACEQVLASDWWERVLEEHRMETWLDRQIYQTDYRAYQVEKSRAVNKYG